MTTTEIREQNERIALQRILIGGLERRGLDAEAKEARELLARLMPIRMRQHLRSQEPDVARR
jgi:hypothetical protein